MPPKRFRNPDLASTPQRQCSPRATHLQRGPPQGEKSSDFLKRSIFFLKPSARIQRIGADFGYRFLWRPLLLAFFATLNAAFFPAGDVLLLFVVVGCVLFLRGLPLLRLSLVLLVENHIRKICARLRVLLFLYNFFLRKTSFSTEKLGEELPLGLSLALLVENYIRESCARFACYFFYAIFSLGKLRFPRIKLHKKSKTPTGFYFSEKIYAEREGIGRKLSSSLFLIYCNFAKIFSCI